MSEPIKDPGANKQFKKDAAIAAAALVEDNQMVGLGTGSTTAFVVEELGRRVRDEGLKIQCVSTSFHTMFLAHQSGLHVLPTHLVDHLDISIDGADEIDPRLNLIKGGGAAHTLEKLVHSMSDRIIIVADYSKLVDQLGKKFAVPVEVLREGGLFVEKRLRAIGAREVVQRQGMNKDGPIITDNGALVLDARFVIEDPERLAGQICAIPGVIEHGIFLSSIMNIERAILGGPDGIQNIAKG